MAPSWPSSGGLRTGASDCQGVEVTWPIALAQKRPTDRNQTSEDARTWGNTYGGRSGYAQIRRDSQQAKPPEADRDLGTGRGQQKGGERKQETAADAGMCHGVQRQAAEAVRWLVWPKTRCATLRYGIVDGEQV